MWRKKVTHIQPTIRPGIEPGVLDNVRLVGHEGHGGHWGHEGYGGNGGRGTLQPNEGPSDPSLKADYRRLDQSREKKGYNCNIGGKSVMEMLGQRKSILFTT